MSLIREASRLRKFASTLECGSKSEMETSALKDAVDYVVGFNMKGLHNIEKDLFFPWVRKKLLADKNLGKYFVPVLDQLESDRRKVENLGTQMVEHAKVAADPSTSKDVRCKSIVQLSDKASAVVDTLESMLHREETLLVPAVARIVPESEQKSFNNKVIRKLGILDSRLHLVGMHEAVWDLKDTSERELFVETIPSIPRMMIPRWKRLLYEPRAGMLN